MEKIEERKRYNEPFLRAFICLANELKITQGELAKNIGTNGSLISEYKAGRKKVGEDMMSRLGLAFKGRLNINYLHGNSQYMLISEVPNDEIAIGSNSDFEIFKRQKPQQDLMDILEIYAQRIRLVDDLRQSLKEELVAVKDLQNDLQKARNDFQEATKQLSMMIKDMNMRQGLMAADGNL